MGQDPSKDFCSWNLSAEITAVEIMALGCMHKKDYFFIIQDPQSYQEGPTYADKHKSQLSRHGIFSWRAHFPQSMIVHRW
jgi:hypothetical protein